MMIDVEALGDTVDAGAAVSHLGGLRRDRLVDPRSHGIAKLNVERNLSEGSAPLRSRPRAREHLELLTGRRLERERP